MEFLYLFELSASNGTNAALTQSFTYAPNGNIVSATGIGSYTYPAASAARPHAVTAIAGQAFTYNANGNMLTGRGRRYVWDGENRPAEIVNASGQRVSFAYWPDGSRARKVVTAPGSALESEALYLGPEMEWSFRL